MGPFRRVCIEHTDSEVDSSIGKAGNETLWCAKGHNVREWWVVGADNQKVAMAHIDEAADILDPELARSVRVAMWSVPPIPTQPCSRGHVDWYFDTDEQYRCRSCKQARYEIKKKANREAYHRRRQKAGKATKRRLHKLTKEEIKKRSSELKRKYRLKKKAKNAR